MMPINNITRRIKWKKDDRVSPPWKRRCCGRCIYSGIILPKSWMILFALALSGCDNEVELRERVDAFLAELAAKADRNIAQSIFDSFRISVAVRTRYVEDELAQAINRGVAQYVILGAGLDSFAYRRQDLAKVLRVLLTRAMCRQALAASEAWTPTESP